MASGVGRPLSARLISRSTTAETDGRLWSAASKGGVDEGSSRRNSCCPQAGPGDVLDSVELPASPAAAATISGFEGVAVRSATEGR
jgi:hypothetical protein